MTAPGCVYGTRGAVANTRMRSRTSLSPPALLTFPDLCSREAFHISEVFSPISQTVNENSQILIIGNLISFGKSHLII